ncbi:HYR domain-containing protein [bacterium SCSIO 12643]|nr:HYR domain-containing protein [bacterium SCSIO 12643]
MKKSILVLLVAIWPTILFSQLTAPFCNPSFTGHQAFFQLGIKRVIFGTIDNSTSVPGQGDPLIHDFTATKQTTIVQGVPKSITVTNFTHNQEDVKVYIDWNNDGDFNDAGELAFSSDKKISHTGSITAPVTSVIDTLIRMRVLSDFFDNGISGPCENIDFGQVEEYAVRVYPNLEIPITIDSSVTCGGLTNGGLTVNPTGYAGPFSYSWSNGDTTASITGLGAGTYTVTVSTTSGFSITSTNSKTVTVQDVTAPTITVCASTPGNITANGSCQGSAPDLTGGVTATDNCGPPAITQSPAAGAILGLGTTTITLIATDAVGNTATCTVNQTVVDNTAPVITICASTPSNISANSFCQGSAPDLTGSVTATDNCTGSPTITQSPASGATLGLGTTTITLTATDGSGNTATCTVNQTVVDDTAPTITVCASTPSNISANSFCQGSAPDLTGSVTATDNCTSSPTITQSPASGATLGLGTTTITLTATDGSGNTATCTVNQTVIDNTAPTITVCASTPSNISANSFCQGSAPDLTGSVTATDNCTGSPTITQSPASGATLGLGTTTITLTATDGSGNTATCTVNQTVVDDTAPVITVCASTPSNIMASNSCTGTAPDLTGGVTATDNCTSSPTITQSPASGATLGLGTTTITLTATDGSGNTATCTVNQTVIDNTAPTITVCASTSNISANGFCQGTAPDLTGGVTATDNCTSSPVITQSPASGATLGLGTTTITLTATDGSGNTATCTVNQTVVDDTAPTITVCASTPTTIVANNLNQASTPDLTGGVTATDNCTGSPAITQSPASGATLGLGTTTITLIATDGSGNTATCTVNQTVISPFSSSISAQTNASCNGFSDGSLTVSSTNGTPPYSYLWSNGGTTATISSLVAGTYAVTMTDDNGLTATSSSTITEPAVLVAATVVDSNTTCNGYSDGGATASATGGTVAYSYAWSNGATTASITGVVAGSYHVTITDANGCTATSSVIITEPAALVAATVVDSNSSCNGSSDGGVSASASGGTGAYSYAWSNGATSASITGVVAGTYTVTVTDANGCTAINNGEVTEPASVIASIAVDSNVSCNGLSDGGLTVSATGGTGAYTYGWGIGASTASIIGLAAGNYSVVITDANGCSDFTSGTVTEPAILTSSVTVDSNVTCNGFSNGGATVSATGGTSPYTYAWSNGATNASITGVVAGSYSVTVTDANGCTSVSNGIVTEPAVLVASTVVDSNVTCNGYLNGGASASATGGTGTYTYVWNNGATTMSITGVAAGSYTVTVTDANGCTSTNSSIITEPASITASIVVDSNVSCNGLSDGGVTVSVSGGTGAYSYGWGTGATTASITGLAAGSYSVAITDANGCSGSAFGTVTEPMVLTSSIAVDSNVTCNGLSNGGATASAIGGTVAYSYIWSNGATTATITGVAAGTYTVTVTDANGCTSSSSTTITEPSVLTSNVVVDSNVTCNGFANGGLTASAAGGTTTYSFDWNNSATTASITGVVAGTYTVTVTDANGCTSVSNGTVTEPTLLVASTVIDSNVTCNGLLDGGATASATGGTGTYTYDWNNSAITASITGVSAGSYTVTVTDANGCTSTNTGVVTEPAVLVANAVIDSNVTCYNGADGGASVQVTGGTTAYSYVWDNMATTSVISGLTMGTYEVTVTDANGCSDTSMVSITEPAPIVINLGNDTSICFGGSLTLDPGAGFHSYVWSDNSTNATLNVNSAVAGAMDYSVTVTNTDGCEGIDTINVNVFVATGVTISGANDLCAYEVDTLIASSGFVSYVWNTTETTTDILVDANALSGGTYSYAVTATDSNGCLSDDMVTFTVFDPVLVDLGQDTSIVWIDGITTEYTLDAGAGFSSYLWSDLSSTSQTYVVDLTNMGNVSVTVTDGNGCKGSDTVFVDFILDVPSLEAAKISVYPNPAHDVVRVEVEGNISGEMEMSLLSMNGKLVEKQILNPADMQNQVQFDVQHLARGVYFIRMVHGAQQEIMRLVIQ